MFLNLAALRNDAISDPSLFEDEAHAHKNVLDRVILK